MVIPILKTYFFEASEAIITKSKSQALHIIRIKYWKVGGSGNPPSLIPAIWNVGILLHEQATLGKHFEYFELWHITPKWNNYSIILNKLIGSYVLEQFLKNLQLQRYLDMEKSADEKRVEFMNQETKMWIMRF